MKVKKLLFILLPLPFILVAIFFSIYNNIPRIVYTYNEAYDGYLVDYVYGNSKEYVIPKEYNGKKVVGFDSRAFYEHKGLESIRFEEETNIKIIARLAFAECNNLKTMSLSNLDEIGKNAFQNCISLDNINFSVERIEGSAFFGCDSLKSVTLTNTDSIGSYAFSMCKSLEELKLPFSCRTVYDSCFLYSGLKELIVPRRLQHNTYIKSLDYVTFY